MQSWSSSLPLPLLLQKWNLRVILSPISWALHYSLRKVKVMCRLVLLLSLTQNLFMATAAKLRFLVISKEGTCCYVVSVGAISPHLFSAPSASPLSLFVPFFPATFSMTLTKCSLGNNHLKPDDMKPRNVPLSMILFFQLDKELLWFPGFLRRVLLIYSALSGEWINIV